VTEARAAYREARERTGPHLDAVARAQQELQEAQIALRQTGAEAARAPFWRRRAAKDVVALANQDAGRAAESYAVAEAAAAPYRTVLRKAEERLQAAERLATTERVRQRLDQLSWGELSRTPTKSRDLGVDLEL
jgi:membrane protein involved in colicin uptake